MSPKKRRKFRNLFIAPHFQSRYILSFVTCCLFPVMLLTGGLFLLGKQNSELCAQNASIDPSLLARMEQSTNQLYLLTGISLLVFVVTIALVGLVYSHRIAGMVFALRRGLNRAANGEFEELNSRKNDEFPELFEEFNHLIRNLKKSQEITGKHIVRA